MNLRKKMLAIIFVAVCIQQASVSFAVDTSKMTKNEEVAYKNLNSIKSPPEPAPAKKQVLIDVDLYDHSEYMDCLDEDSEYYKEGWRYDDSESACRYRATEALSDNELSYRASAGNFSIKLTDDGKASIHYCYGDCDGGADTSIQLPMTAGQLLFGDAPYHLSLSGGDYASGYWSFSADMKIYSKN